MSTDLRQAVIYCRISEDREDEKAGVTRQEEDCRTLAERLDLTVAEVIVENDVGASTRSRKPRPKYAAMLQAVERGKFGYILAYSNGRLTRRLRELEDLIQLHERTGVQIETVVSGKDDLSTADGRMVARIKASVDAAEAERIGERVKRARRQKAHAGGWNGGVRPFGFEPDGVTIKLGEAAEIAKATEAILSGVKLRGVVRELNQRGVPTASGKTTWTASALRDVLLRPRNAGIAVYQGKEIGKTSWSAIVPEEMWRALKALLTDPSRKTNGGAHAVKWLGSGLYVCGVCEQPTLRVGTSGQHRNPAYRCLTRESGFGTGHVTRTAYKLDRHVEAALTRRLMEPDAVVKLERQIASVGIDTVALGVERTAILKRMDDLAGAYAKHAITISQLTRATEDMKNRLAEIDSEMAKAAQRDPLAGLAVGSKDFGDQWFGTKGDRSDGLDLDRRRAIIRSVLTVTVLPAVKPDGKPVRGPRFDPRSVTFDWKRGL